VIRPPAFLRSLLLAVLAAPLFPDALLVPMDASQRDHLKAYGIAWLSVKGTLPTSWLLNLRGGSFLLPDNAALAEAAARRGVTVERLSERALAQVRAHIAGMNAAEIKLEKPPRIAVYTPPNVNPWADAVTLVLEYAEIPYDKVYDREVIGGRLADYDWLHLHHEDFTGQYGKFYAGYRNATWYREKVALSEQEARNLGFETVPKLKAGVAKGIQKAVGDGMFLFAMCAATETIDIALAAQDTDIAPPEIDGTPIDPAWASKWRYEACFAFEKFLPSIQAWENRFSDIDYNQVNTPARKEVTDFVLFDFSAKIDPVPTLLCQNHQTRIAGFFGQTTCFRPDRIKDGVTLLAQSIDGSVRYLHGLWGKGAFTFYGGHAPEDRSHFVGDRAPNLEIHRQSPGYRLILNNVLFPSARPPKKKT